MTGVQQAMMITSGVLDVVGAVSAFLPPPASVITGAVTSIVNIFVPGPPPQPTTTEVIEKISNKIDKGFEEQQEFIASEMKKQKEFMADQFEKINENMKELSDKQQ